MLKLLRIVPLTLLACLTTLAQAAPLKIVAAENFYADVARQIGGDQVEVISIMNNPEDDPHLFEANVGTSKALSAARIVIYNGADYDPWMDKLLAAAKSKSRDVLVVAKLINRKAGDNPHLWYHPATMPALARALHQKLVALDPVHKADYDARLNKFLDSMKGIDQQIAALKAKHSGTPVTATEPVFGYMAEALGFTMRNLPFQVAVMNNTEPSAKQTAAFEQDLKKRQVRILFYNSQATDQSAKRMQDIARQSGVAVIGVTESMPAGTDYQSWISKELAAIGKALE